MPTPTNTVSIAASLAGQHQTLIDILGIVMEELKAVRRALGSSTGASAGILVGSVAWNPADLADGAGETSPNMTVTGAALGDFVLVSVDIDLIGVTLTGYVSAPNTVNARAQNESGAAYNGKDFGTLRALVIPKAAVGLPAMTLTA